MITYRQSNISKDKTLSNLTLFCINRIIFLFLRKIAWELRYEKLNLEKRGEIY